MKKQIRKEENFTTKNIFSIEYFPLSDVVNVDNFINGEELNLVKFSKETIITGDKKETQDHSQQLVISNKTLEEILKDPTKTQAILHNSNKDNTTYLVDKDFWNVFKEEGVNSNISRIIGKDDKDFNAYIVRSCFDDAKKKNYMFIQFIGNKNYLSIIQDVNGNMASEPIKMDYMSGHLDNGNYHLDEMVEHLLKRDDVAFVTNVESYRNKELLKCPLPENHPKLGQIIADIPSYNSEEGRDEYVSLIYYPKSEDIPTFMNWEGSEKDGKNGIYDVRDFIAQEILGCKQFKKKQIVEEQVIPQRKFKR